VGRIPDVAPGEQGRSDVACHPVLCLSWLSVVCASGSEEREFYLPLAHAQQWPGREPDRQINGGLSEGTVLSSTILSAPLREMHPDAASGRLGPH
jgi:hypothetical protein